MTRVKEIVQVNIPFTMLYESYLERFLKYRLNPEIGLDAEALDRYCLSDFERIAETLYNAGLFITLHGPFVDMSPGSPDPKISRVTRDRFEQVLRLIPIFRPRTVVFHMGYDPKRYYYMKDIWVERSLELWSWIAQCVQNEGSSLMLENVYEHGPDDIRILFETLGRQRAGFCLDTGHQAVFSRVPLDSWVDSLGPFIGQLHLHDNSGTQDDHLGLGQGRIDFKGLFIHLNAMKGNPPIITLEPHREKDLWPSLQYLEKLLPW
jgi:sugar phosphate isomerase/epimerase